MNANQRLLPSLAIVCCEMLGSDDPRSIPPAVRADVAAKAGVGQATVDRFLRQETVPRSGDLDKMVAAIADVGGGDWLSLWQGAVNRAREDVSESGSGAADPVKLEEAAKSLERERRQSGESGGATGS